MLLLPVGLMTPDASAVLPTRGLVAAWNLQDGAGTIATEAIGAVHGTLAGSAAWATTDKGTALSLPGAGYVTIPAHAVFAAGLGDMTVSGWTKVSTFTGGGPRILSKTNGAVPWPLDFAFDNDGGGRLVLIRGDGTSYRVYLTNTPLTTGVWYHVVATSPAANSSVTFYLNGALVRTVGPAASVGSAALANGAASASIGRREDGASFTNGVARRVLLRNVILTPAEVAQEHLYG